MKIHLSEYQESWKTDFIKLKEKISLALQHLNTDSHTIQIEHIGSTSIEGLIAKPLIDIQIGVASIDNLDELIQPMQQAGFTWNAKWDLELKLVFLNN